MFFLNLTAAEFLTLLGVLGGLITTLYLLDRAKRRRTVSTLQFWVDAGASQLHQARRKMREPWSLLLQLASLLLLLLAISRMQWGNRESRIRDHVLLVDTSSWAAAKPAAGNAASVLADEKIAARRYLAALPLADRVMLVAADSLATPLTRFTADRRQLTAALDDLIPGFSALNVDAVLSFARQAESWSSGVPGEIVYVGPQLAEKHTAPWQNLNLRIIPVAADRENSGIRQLSVRQLEDEPDSWQAFVRIKNYGNRPSHFRLSMRYGGTDFLPRQLSIAPNNETTAEYNFTTRTSGELIASISPGGALTDDDRATLFVPRSDPLRLVIFTNRPQTLKSLFDPDRRLSTAFFTTAQYTPKPSADIVLLDRFAPPTPPILPTLWIDPTKDYSPLPIKSAVTDSLVSWNTGSSLEATLHAKSIRVPAANTFQLFDGDTSVAKVSKGPVVVIRPAVGSRPRAAVIGFDPAQGDLRFEVATPLLFAELLQWLDPVAFRSLTLTAEQVGFANLALDPAERTGPLQVTDNHGLSLPFTRRQRALQLFVTRPTTVHVASTERERVIGLYLPAVADYRWITPANAAVGLPLGTRFKPPAADLWKWFALVGAFGLFVEWLLFGRGRRLPALSKVVGNHAPRPSNEHEMAAK